MSFSSLVHYVQETGVEMELEENMPLLEWLANNYKTFGAALEIITDRSQEGSQVSAHEIDRTALLEV